MSSIYADKKLSKTEVAFIFKYIIGIFIIFFFAFVFLKFPEIAGEGIKQGIELCLYNLVPSLYPFMVLSTFCVESGIASVDTKLLSGLTGKIFKLPGECAAVILFSMVGGLPVGARMTQNLYEKGIITRQQGQRLLFFVINPGPAFVIGFVGAGMLGSKAAGMIIYLSVILSSLLIGFFSRFLEQGELPQRKATAIKKLNMSTAFRDSVVKSSGVLIEVCAWVVLFSGITGLIEKLPLSDSGALFLKCITEMTKGCSIASGILPIPVIAGIIGFSGICGHFQVMGAMVKLKLKYKIFLTSRIISAALSIILCKAFLEIIPVTYETFALGVKPERSGNSVSLIMSVMMILMAVLFLLGDDYRIIKDRKSKNLKRY